MLNGGERREMEIVFAADAAAEPKVSSIPSPSAPPSSRGNEAALERDVAGGAALRCAGVAFRSRPTITAAHKGKLNYASFTSRRVLCPWRGERPRDCLRVGSKYEES